MEKADQEVIIEGAVTLGVIWLCRNSQMGVAKGFILGRIASHFINQSIRNHGKK